MEQFTNLYQVSKTLRFELQPIPETRKWLDEFSKVFSSNRSDATEENFFATDLNTVEAKKVLIDVLNNIHEEEIINKALNSATAKKIDISQYYEAYINNNDSEKGAYVSVLRNTLKTCFVSVIKEFNKDVSQNVKCKEITSDKLSDIIGGLSRNEILKFIENKADEYSSRDLKKETIQQACKDLKGYWGLLSQFLVNRENYYEFEKEQDTSIATRIVSDLLPTFCLNVSQYQRRQTEYDAIYEHLSSLGVVMQIKNRANGTMERIDAFDTSIYDISNFPRYIHQKGIEEYNAARAKNNELTNLFNQNCGKKKDSKLKPFVKLHKQIGCKASDDFERIEISRDWTEQKQGKQEGISLETVLKKVIEKANEILVPEEVSLSEPRLANLINYLENSVNWEGIYVNDRAIRIFSRYLEDWYSLQKLLLRAKSVGKYDPKKEYNEQFKLNSVVELAPVFHALDTMEFAQAFKDYIYEEYEDILDKKLPPSQNLVKMMCHDAKMVLKKKYDENGIKLNCLDKVNRIIGGHEDNAFKKEENIDDIREMMDSILYVIRFVKLFSIRIEKTKGAPCDTAFLQIVESLVDKDIADWIGLYDAVRNYIQRLPQDEVKDNKLKLNFNSSSLLKGWSIDEVKVKLSMILKNEGIYHLCILKNKKLSTDLVNADIEDNPFYDRKGLAKRMIMRNLKFQTLTGKSYVKRFGHRYTEETDEIQAVENAKGLIKENFLKNYPLLEIVLNKQYISKSLFYQEVNEILANYKQITFIPVDWNLVKKYADEGNMYVFKILSKDYSPKAKGKKDLQTIYWEDVFERDSLHQLAAYGEIFRMEPVSKSKAKPFIHKEGSILVNKRDKNGNVIPDKIYRIVCDVLNHQPLPQPKDDKQEKKTFKASCEKAQWMIDNDMIVHKTAKYDITKDARFYGENPRYFLHNPLTMNFQAKEYTSTNIAKNKAYNDINPDIQKWMHEEENRPYFIGIDRGEKNLIYCCKIDCFGKIESCENYNVINKFNYLEKLKDRAESRLDAKRDWRQQESIRNLKNGYISQVVHKLVGDAVFLKGEEVKPSYIVLENLSREMKGGRQKIDFQVYQKIELALAKKLGFYVNKDVKEGLPGSIKKPLQLVPPVNTFEQIDGKDSFGIMLYTRPHYTSVTDPATGWRQTIYITNGNSEEILEQIVTSFEDIYFDGTDYVFKYTERHANHTWYLYSGINGKSLDRFEYNKKTKEHERYDIVKVLDGLFEGFDKSHSLLEQMRNGKALKKVDEKRTAFESLRKAIKMIQQIRNTGNKTEDDNFLQSPARLNDGSNRHFDTRKANEFEDLNLHKIVDADANGAYNIARKGLIMDAHYRYWAEQDICSDKETSALSWYVSDREWDLWLLDIEQWKKELPTFASRSAKETDGKSQTTRRRRKR